MSKSQVVSKPKRKTAIVKKARQMITRPNWRKAEENRQQ